MTDMPYIDCADGVIHLHGEFTVQNAAAIREAILTVGEGAGSALRIDVSAVSALDVAGLQILFAMAADGVGREIVGARGEVAETLAMPGLLDGSGLTLHREA
ncbi:hypothetical protein KBTX_01504 [wastewater metagenome]|uniref:STAS domain-containing protein n=2 Tax=unclassified sequences TaxID=12908 RepID=A0A5B8RED7_9ZZZZ|nr:STAS domain-containing protein [Arhodomonas sp. KWT]QEA05185.1 hypothetical protein KBTEX_01504 [uncultured organism]